MADSRGSILVITLRSPFARRVRLAVRRLGVPCEERVEDVFHPTPMLFESNPLGLVPSFLTPSGEYIPDSSMILEYLHETHGGRIWPEDVRLRTRVRQASVWAEGIMAATVQWFLESVRPEAKRSQEWLEEQRENIERTLARISSGPVDREPWLIKSEPTQAGWDLGVALEYLSLRMPAIDWSARHGRLETVLDACRRHPVFAETSPPKA